jgi:predicted dehydrogenase
MTTKKLRLGVVGANARLGWAPRSHLLAATASGDFELTGVCTTRRESAEESARKYGARLAFHDFREMVAHPEIDVVAVVVRVPSHYEPTMAALEAGKHVYTEWPLGKNTAQAQEMTDRARVKDVRTMIGLQARVSPALMYMKELIADGYVGRVMSCHVSLTRDGVLQRPSHRTWQRDGRLGANTLTIASGHTFDALRFVLGEFSELSAVVSTQTNEWLETDTKKVLGVTSPDTILINGRLACGAVASQHVAAVPFAGSGYRMEVFGKEGTLVAYSDDSPQLEEVRLKGAQKENTLKDLDIPARFNYVPADAPKGEPYNVAQMYQRFAQAIRSGKRCEPDFDTAMEMHHWVDRIQSSSDRRRAG